MEKATEVKSKIDNIKVTKKITKAMELIASFRINEAQRRMLEARPFIEKVENFITDVACYSPDIDDPLLKPHESEDVVLVMGITSDRGLCGAYNANILNTMEDTVSKINKEGKKVKIDIIGTKGKNYFQYRGVELSKVYEYLSEHPRFLDAREITREIIQRFISEEVDKVIICYTRFINAAEHRVISKQILPIPIIRRIEERSIDEREQKVMVGGRVCRIIPEFIYEPSPQDIISSILPEYVYTDMYVALLESTASEIGARMTAMRNATDNADELIGELGRIYNRVRQQEITLEITELVSAAEFLKTES